MRVRTAIIAIAAGLLIAATGAKAVNIQETVEEITMGDLVMKDGTHMQAHIVKMNGKMYVMMPVDEMPDYLHQQILKLMPQ